MKQINKTEVEIFTDPTNYAIVRLPGRKYPGVVFQGDSLSILSEKLGEIFDYAKDIQNEDLIFSLSEVKTQVENILKHYETVLESCGVELPYAINSKNQPK